MKKLLILTVALALMGCAAKPTAYDPVRIFYARPLIIEEWYRDLHAQMERCSGKHQSFDSIQWFMVAPGGMGRTESGEHAGLWSFPNRIYLDAKYVLADVVIRHELMHYLMQEGDSAHDDPIFAACTQI